MRKKPEILDLHQELRASFFYRKRAAFKNAVERAKRLRGEELNWERPQEFGISKGAWEAVEKKGFKPWLVFCHPRAIMHDPSLIIYYRSMAVLSQKGVHQRLSFGVQAFEEGRSKRLSEERALELSRLFNRQISSLVESDPHFEMEDLWLVAAMNFGTQINGSWRNEIGAEGTRRVKDLILKHLFRKGALEEAKLADGSKVDVVKPEQVDLIRTVRLKNGYRIAFGSEPDIAIYPPGRRVPCAAIEVKAGIDPAGALERYGAAKKSFDNVLRRNKRAITIYLASAITKEVEKRIKDDRAVLHHFDLTKVLRAGPSKFLSLLDWILHLGAGGGYEGEGLHSN